MKGYNNLYTDLACFIDNDNDILLNDFKEGVYDKHEEMKDRFLYGYDYYVSLFYKPELDDYFQKI